MQVNAEHFNMSSKDLINYQLYLTAYINHLYINASVNSFIFKKSNHVGHLKNHCCSRDWWYYILVISANHWTQ